MTYEIPEEWNGALIYHFFKVGKTDCNNYRGTSLHNIYAKIIRRLHALIEALHNEEHHGFIEGRSFTDFILILRQVIQKKREFNLQTHFVYYVAV
jgi:hypothetical protein